MSVSLNLKILPFKSIHSNISNFLQIGPSRVQRFFTMHIHPKADSSNFLKITTFLAKELAKDRHALNNIKRQMQNKEVSFKEKQQPLYRLLNNYMKNPCDRSLIAVAINLIKIAEDIWQDQKIMPVDNVISSFFARMGLYEKYTVEPGSQQEQGRFFSCENEQGKFCYKPLTMDQLENINTFLFDGIDQDGIRTTGRIFEPLHSILSSNQKASAEHYFTPPSVRGAWAASVMRSRNVHFHDQEESAKKILKSRGRNSFNLNMTIIAYSYGTIHAHGVTHALYKLLIDPKGAYKFSKQKADELLKQINLLNVGTQSYWSAGENWGKNRKILNIWAGDDLFGVHTIWTEMLLRKTVNRLSARNTPCVAYVNPENANQVLLYITPGVLPSMVSVDGKSIGNVGGHGFAHYLAPFGLLNGIPAMSSRNDHLLGTGEILRNFIQGKEFSKPLADQLSDTGLPVKLLQKDLLEKQAQGVSVKHKLKTDDKIMLFYARRLANETLAKGGTHPILNGMNKINNMGYPFA